MPEPSPEVDLETRAFLLGLPVSVADTVRVLSGRWTRVGSAEVSAAREETLQLKDALPDGALRLYLEDLVHLMTAWKLAYPSGATFAADDVEVGDDG